MSHNLPKATVDVFPRAADLGNSELFETSEGGRLKAAIDSLYEAFGGKSLSHPFRYCEHCFTERDAQYLASTRSRDLLFADITILLGDLTGLLGSPDDLNYLLPRVLEALAYQALAAGWTDAQLDAVLAFMRAYIVSVNALDYNLPLWMDLTDGPLAEIAIALPELAGELAIELRPPNAMDPI